MLYGPVAIVIVKTEEYVLVLSEGETMTSTLWPGFPSRLPGVNR
jgi:hypothetical protein